MGNESNSMCIFLVTMLDDHSLEGYALSIVIS